MNPDAHARAAERIGASLARCDAGDYEVIIEGAMLAGAHWLNAALHATGLTAADQDALHSEFLTLGERRRLAIVLPGLVESLDAIEDMRAPYVRGAEPGGEAAARRALHGLEQMRAIAHGVMSKA